jgi:hypothetical protein
MDDEASIEDDEEQVIAMQIMITNSKSLGPEHPETLISMANLASIYDKRGRWKEAEELLLQIVETKKRVLGQEHLETMSSRVELTQIFFVGVANLVL